MTSPSSLLVFGFIGLVVATFAAALFGVHTSDRSETKPTESDRDRTAGPISTAKVAAVGLLWLAVTGAIAFSGLAARWDLRPPPTVAIVGLGIVLTCLAAASRFGRQISLGVPVAGLIAFQSFRFPLELLMHRAYTEGQMPIQMSFEGRNFDIVTGLLGLVIGGFFLRTARNVPTILAWVFNGIGVCLLFNIMGIAVVSTPTIQAFGPDAINDWIGRFPFIWLPTVFVTCALFGHLALTRRLLADMKS